MGFFSDNGLKKISYDGNESTTLGTISNPFGAYWASDDHIYIANAVGNQLCWISSSGGEKNLIKLSTPEQFIWPTVLPGNRHLIASGLNTRFFVYLISLETGEVRTLPIKGMHVQYIPTGHLVHNEKGRLFATPFI